jgi:uncharacterized membrane-anchored protein YhcB (DUF1043 family)
MNDVWKQLDKIPKLVALAGLIIGIIDGIIFFRIAPVIQDAALAKQSLTDHEAENNREFASLNEKINDISTDVKAIMIHFAIKGIENK